MGHHGFDGPKTMPFTHSSRQATHKFVILLSLNIFFLTLFVMVSALVTLISWIWLRWVWFWLWSGSRVPLLTFLYRSSLFNNFLILQVFYYFREHFCWSWLQSNFMSWQFYRQIPCLKKLHSIFIIFKAQVETHLLSWVGDVIDRAEILVKLAF